MFRKNATNKGDEAITESLRNFPGDSEFIPPKRRERGIELRRVLAFLVVTLILVSTFAPCVPVLEAVSGNIAQLRVSYVVQPDRINVPYDKIQEYGYNIRFFQNDDVSFSVYLTNQGDITAEKVTATLEVPEGLGFNLTNDTVYYGDIEPQEISIGNFSFLTNNVSKGLYNITLTISYQDVSGTHIFKTNLIVKVIDIGITKITHSILPSIYQNETEEDFLTPLDSAILGYNAIFQSKDEKDIVIRIKNGGNNLIENLTIDILPPSDVNIEIQNIPKFKSTSLDYSTNFSFFQLLAKALI